MELSPNDDPISSNYEVVQETDVVIRTVDFYPDGHAVRNSVKLAEREGPDLRPPEFRSLVHGPFLRHAEEFLTPITGNEFEVLWDSAQNKSWPPKE